MWTKAFFHSLQKETELTWKFFIKIEVDKFNYTAGQFIQVKINDLIRSYSIASFNENSNIVELIIVKLEGGDMSTLLFEKITEGDELEVKGPLGKFVLPDVIDNDIFFICTGTGLAPFRSMLKYINLKIIKLFSKFNKKKVFLVELKDNDKLTYFNAEQFNIQFKDILYFEEMNYLNNSMINFKYIPTLSREKWIGKSGYVHEQYLNILKNKSVNNPIFYLCGWRNMIKEARTNLKGLGFESKKIKLEIYG